MAITPMHGGTARLTFTVATADVTAGQFVKASALTSQQIIAAGAVATGGADGIAAEDCVVGAKTTMIMLVPGTVVQVLAESGVAAGDLVKISANGKATTATAPTDNASAGDDGFLIVGRALTATASGMCFVLIN